MIIPPEIYICDVSVKIYVISHSSGNAPYYFVFIKKNLACEILRLRRVAICDMLLIRRSAILAERLFCNGNEVSYYKIYWLLHQYSAVTMVFSIFQRL